MIYFDADIAMKIVNTEYDIKVVERGTGKRVVLEEYYKRLLNKKCGVENSDGDIR